MLDRSPTDTQHYIGIDANTTPTPSTDWTGQHVLTKPPPLPLMVQRLDTLLEVSKTWIPQTYNQGGNDIWTRTRPKDAHSQLDYILVPRKQEDSKAATDNWAVTLPALKQRTKTDHI